MTFADAGLDENGENLAYEDVVRRWRLSECGRMLKMRQQMDRTSLFDKSSIVSLSGVPVLVQKPI
jgi:hypothetical protein